MLVKTGKGNNISRTDDEELQRKKDSMPSLIPQNHNQDLHIKLLLCHTFLQVANLGKYNNGL